MRYYFVVDTDTYSGNFERQLCAYITGRCGDWSPAGRIAEFALKSPEVGDIGQHVIDMNGEYGPVPVTIVPTPGFYNDGVGNHHRINKKKKPLHAFPAYQSVAIRLDEKPTPEILKAMCRRAREFSAICSAKDYEKIGCDEFDLSNFGIIGFRLIVKKTSTKSIKLEY